MKLLAENAMAPAPGLTRRAFLRDAALLTVAAAANALPTPQPTDTFVQTVLGPIPASQLGVTLVHELVMCDFIDADQTNRRRWQVEDVVNGMLPVLSQLKYHGVTSSTDSTPIYVGVD